MQVLFSDFKKLEFRLRLETLDDLWHMVHFFGVGDVVSATSERKIKIGDDTSGKAAVVRKVVSLSLAVTKVTFSEEVLRVSGTLTAGPDDVALHSYHTFSFAVGDTFHVLKAKLLTFQKKHYDDALTSTKPSVLLVALDRDTAAFALVRGFSLAFLGEISGCVAKKYTGHVSSGDFFLEVVRQIEQYVHRYTLRTVVVGSPAFWKDEFAKVAPVSLRPLLLYATCHQTGKEGLYELLQRDEVRTALSRERLTREFGFVEEFFSLLRTDPGRCRYGLSDVLASCDMGAVVLLLVTDRFLVDLRAQDLSGPLDAALEAVEKSNGEVHIISAAHQAGERLMGLGGIVCVLRYALE